MTLVTGSRRAPPRATLRATSEPTGIEAPRREPGGLRVACRPVGYAVWRGVPEAAKRRRGVDGLWGREGVFGAAMQRGFLSAGILFLRHADWACWWWALGGYHGRDGPTARRPPGSRRGASMRLPQTRRLPSDA